MEAMKFNNELVGLKKKGIYNNHWISGWWIDIASMYICFIPIEINVALLLDFRSFLTKYNTQISYENNIYLSVEYSLQQRINFTVSNLPLFHQGTPERK